MYQNSTDDLYHFTSGANIITDDYQYERAERLGVSSMGIWHALKRLNVTYKKNAQTSQGRSRKACYFLSRAESL
ncbi:hypothetical protein Cva_00554 [Caedimonas varicaedens]|uniref:Uncharacterized protein n=1 Tax=Caedimonas varicaedens TaxID=1629334 RepID=A0A0K8MCI4_9PROT|nr:hypothetical protein Cva_00554 [Caedimonas varicaedens]